MRPSSTPWSSSRTAGCWTGRYGTIKQFAQVGSIVGHAETSGYLRTLLQEGKRIVITTVQKFRLDPILDACVSVYREQLDEDGQVDFKGKAKAFLREYGFLASILPYTYTEWEEFSIFRTFLVSKLPAPVEDDLSKGILEAIDMDSYRVEKQAVQDIQLPDEDAEIRTGPHRGWRAEA